MTVYTTGGAVEAREGVERKAAVWKQSTGARSPGVDALRTPSSEAYKGPLEVQLLRSAEQLRRLAGAADLADEMKRDPVEAGRRLAELGFSHDEADALTRWRDLFAREIGVVLSARNSVAHGQQIPRRDLEAAVEVAGDLLELAGNPP